MKADEKLTITTMSDETGRENDPVRAISDGLRRLIESGQTFRSVRGRELQLGQSDLVALGHLHVGGSMAPKDLSALTGVTSGTMTALLDRVEKAGFLKREHNPEDRRALLIHLTPAGEHAMQWLSEQFDTAIRDSLARVPGPDVARLEKVLNELSSALETDSTGSAQEAQGQPLTSPPRLHGI